MGIHDFKYPIMPDRVYTVIERDTGRSFDVMGDILIAAYLLYKDTSIPSEYNDLDDSDRLF
jgi:hypothetical protein